MNFSQNFIFFLKKKGLHERLSNIPDDGNLIDQLQVQISAFEEQEELMKDWFSRFGNMEVSWNNCK